MSFAVADDYDRFMGRFSTLLSPKLADFAGVEAGWTVLDVGCGTGALLGELVRRVGEEAVAAVDPSEPFVTAARERHPGVDIRVSGAEELPYPDDRFDAALAQLVVHFMADAVAGLREMARVTRTGGAVAACVWDFGGDRAPLSPFWRAARELDPGVDDESGHAGTRVGHLAELLAAAGLRSVEECELAVALELASFDEWWEPFTLGAGTAGSYARSLDADALEALRERSRELLPDGPFTFVAHAWGARGTV